MKTMVFAAVLAGAAVLLGCERPVQRVETCGKVMRYEVTKRYEVFGSVNKISIVREQDTLFYERAFSASQVDTILNNLKFNHPIGSQYCTAEYK